MEIAELHRTSILLAAGMGINFIASAWAYLAHLRRRNTLGPYFWALVTLGQAAVLIQAGLGLGLVLGGLRARSGMHYMYGAFAFLTMVVQYGLRPGGAARLIAGRGGGFREPLVLALLSLFLAGLLARAYMTGRVSR